jgi:hypothetical protein
MADLPARAKREDVVVFTASVDAVTKELIEQLKEKYGLQVRVRSSVTAVDGLLARAVDAVGYDRTFPGYGRNYDRDPIAPLSAISRTVNPALARLREPDLGGED